MMTNIMGTLRGVSTGQKRETQKKRKLRFL